MFRASLRAMQAESTLYFDTLCQGSNQRYVSGSMSVPALCVPFVDPSVVLCVSMGVGVGASPIGAWWNRS